MRKFYILFFVALSKAGVSKAQDVPLAVDLDSTKYFEWDSDSASWVFTSILRDTINVEEGKFGYIDQRETRRYITFVDTAGNELEDIRQNYDSDNDTWVNYSNRIKTFDEWGNTTSYYDEAWDVDAGAWIIEVGEEISISEYDELGQVIGKKEQTWDGSAWYDSKVWTYTLNGEGLVEEITAKSLNSEGYWIKENSNALYEYDEDGNVLFYTVYLLDPDNDSSYTTKRRKYCYEYNDAGQEVKYYQQSPNSSDEWAPYSYKYEYTYNENGEYQTRRRERAYSEVYALYDSISYVYNDDDQLISQLEYTANGDRTAFVIDERFTYEYDAHGNQVRELDEEWVDGAWVVDSDELADYFYDFNDILVALEESELDGDVYVNTDKEAYYYSCSVAPEFTITTPDTTDSELSIVASQSVRLLNDTLLADSIGSAIVITYGEGASDTLDITVVIDSLQKNIVITPASDYELDVTYTLSISGLEGIYNNAAADTAVSFTFESPEEPVEPSKLDLQKGKTVIATVYPNPAQGFIKIQGEANSYKLFNAAGLLIKENSFLNNITIDTSELENGLYILSVENGTEVQLERVIIRK